jgi:PP-loop superfamily ATP-utilizing enzyme
VEEIKGKKIEITVPEGYNFLQQGNSCYFVKKRVQNFLSWENKEAGLTIHI